MIGIGFWEIMLILVLALVLLKPAQLPKAAQTIGLVLAKMRRFYQICHFQWTNTIDLIETKAHHQSKAPKHGSPLDQISD